MIRPTNAVVDFAALRHNIAEMRSKLPANTRYMAVIKAQAYGHGLEQTAKAAVAAGVDFLGVAVPEEGLLLREAGVTVPILVFGALLDEYAEMMVRHELRASVFTLQQLHALRQAAETQGRTALIHLKVDTGMNRIGVKTLDECEALLREVRDCSCVELEGMFTHFAVCEIPDKAFTMQQLQEFHAFTRLAQGMGFSPILHAANSGAILDLFDQTGLDMVRGGISMYGYHPDPACGEWADLHPVLSWKTAIVHIKEIEPGETISYGRRYTAQTRRRIATLPLGYGDGYHRCMTGKAQVWLHGQRAPVVGTICMDQIMIDITDVPEAGVGDVVFLIGGEGPQAITADDLAGWAGTISYEVLLSIRSRVPRVYINEE